MFRNTGSGTSKRLVGPRLALGCIQVIDPGAFATCCRNEVEEWKYCDAGETFPATNPIDRGVPSPFSEGVTLLRDLRTAEALPSGEGTTRTGGCEEEQVSRGVA